MIYETLKILIVTFAIIGIATVVKACYYEIVYHIKNHKKTNIKIKTDRLVQLIDKYGKWNTSPCTEDNDKAKNALKEFYIALQKCKPDKKYIASKRGFHLSYLINIVAIQQACKDKNYVLMAHEIVTIIHYEGIFQSRIYFNLLNILYNLLEG